MRPRKKVILRCSNEITESVLRFVLETVLPIDIVHDCDVDYLLLGCAVVFEDQAAIVDLSRFMTVIELVRPEYTSLPSLAHHTVCLNNMGAIRERITQSCVRRRGPRNWALPWNYRHERKAA